MDLSFLTKEQLNTLFVVAFYVGIVALVYFNRKKFEIQSGFIAIYRTKFGLKFMERFGKKHKELIKILGYIGIGIGFVGMIFISFYLIKNLYDVVFVPGTTSGVAPALPGVKVPGSPIFIPLIAGWISLFIVTMIHEFSHGIVAVANGLKVKSSGVAFFGPIMGAFVEPDEKMLVKKNDVTQYSIFAAGPFSNILLTIVAFLLMIMVASPVINAITVPTGFSFEGISAGMPAAAAGVLPSVRYTQVNGIDVNNDSLFVEVMDASVPNQTVVISNENVSFAIITGEHPNNKAKGYAGVTGVQTEFKIKHDNWFYKLAYPVMQKVSELLFLIFLLSSGIGIMNLLPLGPIDGGRMLQISLIKTNGKKKGTKLWSWISVFFLIVLLLNVIVPLVVMPLLKKLLLNA
jgi:membrane-associated protease RseP (regulator of RpoE activity)